MFNAPAPTEIYTLSLHDALPILVLTAYTLEGTGVGVRQRLAASIPAWLVSIAAAGVCVGLDWWLTVGRSEEHTSELQSHSDLVCRLLLEKKKKIENTIRVDSENN